MSKTITRISSNATSWAALIEELQGLGLKNPVSFSLPSRRHPVGARQAAAMKAAPVTGYLVENQIWVSLDDSEVIIRVEKHFDKLWQAWEEDARDELRRWNKLHDNWIRENGI